MFENLSERLERSFKILKGEGKITELNVAETLKDVRRALLEADVNYNVAKKFTEDVKEKALGQDVLTAVRPGELMVKIVHDELANLMGGKAAELNLTGMPAIILMSGLQGSGKTTFSGKLANLLKTKQGKKPMLVAGDVYRPAAIEQLRVLAGQLDVPVFFDLESKDPVSIARRGVAEAMGQGCDVVIIDTAGRLAVDEEMMREIEEIKRAIRPSETLFVVDSMTGQDAVNTAKTFNERLDFDGVVLTKLDGDDIVSLVERAQQLYDEREAKRLEERIAKDQFDFNDFLAQIQQIKKMGNIKDLAAMIPGVGKALKDIDIKDDAFKSIEAIIYSMTPEERAKPHILDGHRRKRIALGSGTSVQDVNKLLTQFTQTRKMMKTLQGFKGGKMPKMPKMPFMGGGKLR